MKFNRRSFLKSTSIITAGLFLPANKIVAALQEETGSMQSLRNNVGIYTERGGTIGWLISDDGIIVIDSQFPDTAKNFTSMLQELTHKKINIVFNTHHHRDHTSGNSMLQKICDDFVAHANTVSLQKKFYGEGENAASQIYANVTFVNQWSTTIGNETITAEHLWGAHTGGDSFIHFKNANVVHLGDLIFNNMHPFIDRPGGAHIQGWINYLEELLKRFDSDTIFIFGHGISVTGGKDDLSRMRDYLSALLDFVNRNIKEGKTKEEVSELISIPGFEHLGEEYINRLKINLIAAYEELTSN